MPDDVLRHRTAAPAPRRIKEGESLLRMTMEGKAAAKTCCSQENCIVVWQILAVVFILMTLVVVIVSTIFVAKQDSLFRVCVDTFPVNEANAHVFGFISLDTNSNSIKYVLRSSAAMTGITAVHLRGPIQLGTEVGPIAAALCGAPSASATCDITTTPGALEGEATQIYDGVPPESTDPRPLMQTIRANPHLYYLEILSNAAPVTPGACRAPMTSVCGFP